jgi:hypothetical protein
MRCPRPQMFLHLATENAPRYSKWKDKYPRLSVQCRNTWWVGTTQEPSPEVLVWHQKHLMETYEQYNEYCLNLAAERHFEAAEIHCVLDSCMRSPRYDEGCKSFRMG